MNEQINCNNMSFWALPHAQVVLFYWTSKPARVIHIAKRSLTLYLLINKLLKTTLSLMSKFISKRQKKWCNIHQVVTEFVLLFFFTSGVLYYLEKFSEIEIGSSKPKIMMNMLLVKDNKLTMVTFQTGWSSQIIWEGYKWEKCTNLFYDNL